MPMKTPLQMLRAAAAMEGLSKSYAVIEFAPDGTILDANDAFLRATGYSRAGLIGQAHRILVTPEEAASAAYRGFWASLAAGQLQPQGWAGFMAASLLRAHPRARRQGHTGDQAGAGHNRESRAGRRG